MANHCRASQAAATAACNALVDLLDAGGAGSMKIYTGAEPTHCDDAAGTLVATLALPNPAFEAASYVAGTHTSDAALSAAISDENATGNASAVTYFRLCNNAGNPVLQGTIGTSGADLNLNTTTIAAGSQVDISTFTVKVPIDQA